MCVGSTEEIKIASKPSQCSGQEQARGRTAVLCLQCSLDFITCKVKSQGGKPASDGQICCNSF